MRLVIVLLIVSFGMYLRFVNRSNKELSMDEPYQINTMKVSLWYAISDARRIMQFPGDVLLVYPFYKLFGENKWGLAIPHIIITILGFYLLYILCGKYFKTTWGYIIAFSLVALNNNLISHAFEIRPYAVLANLGIAVFVIMQYIFEKESPSRIMKVLISIFIITVILFHLYGSLIIFFAYLFHILFSRKENTIRYFISKHLKYYGVSLLIALPIWYYFAFGSDKSYLKSFTQTSEGSFEYIHRGIIPMAKGIFGNLICFKKLYFLLAGLIFAFLIPHKERLKQIMFFIVMIMLPIGLILLSSIIYKYWFLPRQFVWAMPLFAFLIGWCWNSAIVYFMGKFTNKSASLP
ncbi:MAG: hypothetical protein PHS33_04230 [Candidatus Omnitrophica bacterium]|nr:hypothetical protein [Candidatus Omnitrophota bacterium]